MGSGDPAFFFGKENHRGMLKNGCQRDHWLSVKTMEKEFSPCHTKTGPPGNHFFNRTLIRGSLRQRDIKARVPVETFFQCGIISRELELVQPCQLKPHLGKFRISTGFPPLSQQLPGTEVPT